MKLPISYVRTSMRIVALVLIVWMGAYFRFTGLASWDEPSFRLHPDERFLTEVATQIQLPGSFQEYLDSSNTPLNPRNGNYKFFVYGMLPHELTRLSAVLLTSPEYLPEQVDRGGVMVPNPEYALAQAMPSDIRLWLNPTEIDYTAQIHVVGRGLSALFDILSLLVVFLLARRLYDETIAFVTAFMYAGTAFLIQQTHFFTVDATSAFFIVLTVYFAVKIHQNGYWSDYLWGGVAIGGAIACRITLATVAVAVIVAAGARIVAAFMRADRRHMMRDMGLLVLSGVMAVMAARLLGPDMFAGTMPTAAPQVILGDKIGSVGQLLDSTLQGKGFFDLRPDARFLQSMSDISRFASGEIDWPPTQQWAARPRYLFALSNMVWAGMGAPLGIAAWLGFVGMGWMLWRRQQWQHLVPWSWVVFFFGWQGGQFLMTMRYYLPIYGMLIMMAAWLVVMIARQRHALYTKLMGLMWRSGDPVLHRDAAVAWGRGLAFVTVLPALIVAIGAVAWGYAFSRIYSEDHTRIAASRWIYANIPPGATLSSEIWDDGLPLSLDGRGSGDYVGVGMPVYAEDEAVKYYGDGTTENTGLLMQLDQIDYIILSSNRVYDTAGRLVMRYPALINYYKSLFDGSLGFTLVAEFRSSPRLLGVEFPTAVWAEEAFSVYDHPRVLIFKKTPEYSRAKAEALIMHGVAFGEVYKLPTIRASKVMTALHFTDVQWPTYRDSAGWWQTFSATTTTFLPWLWWLLALEFLSLLAFFVLQRWLQSLPDRGLALSKTLGLLIVAWLIWLAASVGVLAFTRTGIVSIVVPLLLLTVGLYWRKRAYWQQIWQQHKWILLTTQGLFWLAYLAFVLIRAANPDLWHPARGGEKPMDLAFLTAVVRSPAFPPYDPWFAGGMLNYYYFGFVMVGVLVHLTGIAPATAYNLAVPTMFALTTVGVWGVALALQGWRGSAPVARWRAWWQDMGQQQRRKLVGAVLAAVFVTVAGNWSQALWMLPGSASPNANCGTSDSYAAVALCQGRGEWAFWDATRVVSIKTGDGVINEFPFFTFLFADLHAHMIGLPLLVAALATMTALIRQPKLAAHWREFWRDRWVLVGILALFGGTSYATNTWDYPTIMGMSVLTLLLLLWRDYQYRPQVPSVIGWVIAMVGFVLGSRVASWPFTRAFASDYTGFEVWNGPRTPTSLFVEISGLWIFAAISAFAVLLVRLRFAKPMTAAGVVLATTALFLVSAWMGVPAIYVQLSAMTVLVLVLSVLLTRTGDDIDWLAWWRTRAPAVQLELPVFADMERRPLARAVPVALETVFVIIMVLAVFGISALTEVLVAKGDIGRMNSVFKFGMQVWVFGGISAGILLAWVWQRLWTYALQAQVLWRAMAMVAVAMALVYPLTATPARIAERYDTDAGLSLDGEAFLTSPIATWNENDYNFTFAEDAAGIAWLRTHVTGTPIILEAHAEAYRWSARIATYTGLPTLIGWPWHETQQRSVADVGPVLSARQEMVRRWYTGESPSQLLDELKLYGVEYVYVGQMERALYGVQAQTTFADLAQKGQIAEVFRNGETVIYQVPVADHAPAVLKPGTLARLDPTDPPSREPMLANAQSVTADAMLSVSTARLEAVARPGWNPMQSTVGIVLLWMLAWYAIGLFGLPVALWWGEQHWPWARLLGLLMLGYAVWLPVSARLMYNDTTGLVVGFVLVGLVNLWALMRIDMRQNTTVDASSAWWFALDQVPDYVVGGAQHVYAVLRQQWRRVAAYEAVYWLAFVVMVLIRMANPDLWHPIWGGEKPFEFGLLNAVLQSPVMPPYSPFYSGGVINYYYYGYVLYALPIRLTGVLPEVGYNLILASLYALVVMLVTASLYHVTRRWWAALIGVLLVAVMGNPATVLPIGWSEGIAPVWSALQSEGIAGFGRALGDWFVGPSRVIPSTINEFPAWSFLFGDLHAHILAMPVMILVLALAWHALQAPRLTGVWWGLVIVALGTLAITNSWDAPTALLVVAGAIYWRPQRAARLQIVITLVMIVSMVAGAYVTFLPFFQQYVPQISGVALVSQPSPWGAWLSMWGMFFVPTLAAIGLLVAEGRRTRIILTSVVVVMSALVSVAALLPAEQWSSIPVRDWLQSPVPWLVVVVLCLAGALLRRRGDATVWFGLWLLCVAWAVALGVEFVYIRDHMDGGDWYRMNTVFKFGIQTWLLLSMAVAVLAERLWRASVASLPTWARQGVLVLAVIPVVMGAVYPFVAVPNRTAYRIDSERQWTLNGLQFMDTGSYFAFERTIPFASDYAAMQWLRTNTRGLPVVLQASNEFYRDYGVRIAANTGLPTVVSPLHESEQRNPTAVARRDADVIEFYRSTNLATKMQILARYQVGYIVVGPIERAVYGDMGIASIAQIPHVTQVFSQGETTIYMVLPPMQGVAPLGALDDVQPQAAEVSPAAEDTMLDETIVGLEDAFYSDPSNIDTMMLLVDAYRQVGRFNDAADVIGMTILDHPDDVMLLHMYGDSSLEAGLIDQGIQALRDAVDIDNAPGNINKLISGQIDAGLFDAALVDIADGLAAYPDFYDFLVSQGRVYALMGNDDMARQSYQEYLKQAPADALFREDVRAALSQLER
jgi:YYY domain-containing protein